MHVVDTFFWRETTDFAYDVEHWVLHMKEQVLYPSHVSGVGVRIRERGEGDGGREGVRRE